MRSVCNLVDSLNEHVDNKICTRKSSDNTFITPHSTTPITFFRINKIPTISSVLKIFLHLQSSYKKNNLVFHIHGIWDLLNHTASCYSKLRCVPYIIHVRGMLDDIALEYRKYRKYFAYYLYQYNQLLNSSVLIATSTNEFESIRKLNIKSPIALIPNGITLPSISSYSSFSVRNNVILCICRIHPIKGLENLIRAWAKSSLANFKLIIAGPDENNYRTYLKNLVNSLNLNNSVIFRDEVNESEKVALYQSSKFFILPSFTENFGTAIAESLSHGLPVITTNRTPWKDLDFFNCGWSVDIGVNPLVAVLDGLSVISSESWKLMSDNSIKYVSQYNWSDVASMTFSLYNWVLGYDSKPDFVYYN